MRLSSYARFFALPLLAIAATAQTPSSAPASPPPVSYASANELNGMLSQLEQTSRAMQSDLSGLRIERWKTDSNTKRNTAGDVDSIERNLREAMPEMVGQLRNSPESLGLTFKLYRNLGALYDVFTSVVESAGAFGSKDEYQSVQNDLSGLAESRKALADRMDKLSNEKETELTQLRAQLKAAQAAAATASEPVKKTVVDDLEPTKKPARKKKSTNTSKTANPSASTTPTKPNSNTNPPQSQQ